MGGDAREDRRVKSQGIVRGQDLAYVLALAPGFKLALRVKGVEEDLNDA